MKENINMKGDNTETKKDTKKIAFLFVGISTLVVAIAGATFAWFAVTATNTDVVKGESGYVENALTLLVTHSTNSTVGTKKMIPQLDSAIDTATNTTYKCVDGNGNAVCKVFQITVTNTTDTKFYITGTLNLSATNMPNLKWSQCSGANTCTSNTFNPKSTTALVNNVELAGKASISYYVVVWISEQSTAQTDSGSFTGTVTFDGYNDANKTAAGVTSTIRS